MNGNYCCYQFIVNSSHSYKTILLFCVGVVVKILLRFACFNKSNSQNRGSKFYKTLELKNDWVGHELNFVLHFIKNYFIFDV